MGTHFAMWLIWHTSLSDVWSSPGTSRRRSINIGAAGGGGRNGDAGGGVRARYGRCPVADLADASWVVVGRAGARRVGRLNERSGWRVPPMVSGGRSPAAPRTRSGQLVGRARRAGGAGGARWRGAHARPPSRRTATNVARVRARHDTRSGTSAGPRRGLASGRGGLAGRGSSWAPAVGAPSRWPARRLRRAARTRALAYMKDNSCLQALVEPDVAAGGRITSTPNCRWEATGTYCCRSSRAVLDDAPWGIWEQATAPNSGWASWALAADPADVWCGAAAVGPGQLLVSGRRAGAARVPVGRPARRGAGGRSPDSASSTTRFASAEVMSAWS